jgi:hypothetical protein
MVWKLSVPLPPRAGTGCGATASTRVSISIVQRRNDEETHPRVTVPLDTPPSNH